MVEQTLSQRCKRLVPGPLRPLACAYILACISSIGPRVFSLLIAFLRGRKKTSAFLASVRRVLCSSFALHQFPTFCGTLVGGFTILQIPIRRFLKCTALPVRLNKWDISTKSRIRLGRFIAAFLSAWAAFRLLDKSRNPLQNEQTKPLTESRYVIDQNDASSKTDDITQRPASDQPALVGRTMDLTAFAAVRALDVVIGSAWARFTRRNASNKLELYLLRLISRYTDTCIFAVSSSIIMWSWFYLPNRLPAAYNKWISEAAQVDPRLVEALRRARQGRFVYGKDTGQAPLLQSMCKDYSWPLEWGDPSKTVPMPCEMVHMGIGPSCEKHALFRFVTAFRYSLGMYLPLNLVVKLRNPSIKGFRYAIRDAVRSSAFLGAYISLFYYSVCLSRTRIGPKLVSQSTVTPLMWDSGLCVAAGCCGCGWSILLESEKRRQEIAFFVAPRAAAAVLPRRYSKEYQWRETLVFCLSAALILTSVQEDPARVRGFFGRLLNQVLNC